MKTNIHLVVALLSSTFLVPSHLLAADYTQGSHIVKFQYKLASRGNAGAQYRLARMLEAGDGIDVDLDEAKHWYELAAKSGLKKASQRSTYLKVKQQGFDAATDTDWLNSVKIDADRHKPDAVLLQALLYRQGLGVKKDLNKALKLFNEVRIRGVADVYDDIASINQEMQANTTTQRRKQQIADKQARLLSSKEKPQPVKKTAVVPAKDVKTIKQKKPAKVAEAEVVTSREAEHAEKIRRYKKAMMTLKQEQAIIDAQQTEITGDAADDEI